MSREHPSTQIKRKVEKSDFAQTHDQMIKSKGEGWGPLYRKPWGPNGATTLETGQMDTWRSPGPHTPHRG